MESICVRHLGGDHDPAAPLQLDVALIDAEAAQPVEVAHDAVWERQVLSGGEPGDAFAVALQPPDLGAQILVDLPDAAGELLGAGIEKLLDPGERHAGVGQGADLDQSHNRGSVVGAVAGVGALGLRQQPDLVVVAYRPHRHPGVCGQPADGEHGSRLPQAILRW